MKISPDKDAAYPSESVKVTVQTEGAYSPKVFVQKTSNDSFVGNLSMKSGKANNPLKVKSKTAIIKYKKLKKTAVAIPVSKVMCFKNKGAGKRTYTLTSAKKDKKSFKKYFKVNPKNEKIK